MCFLDLISLACREDQGSLVVVKTFTKMSVSIPNFFSAFVQCLQLSLQGLRGRCSFAMLDFEIILLKSLDPASYLTLRFPKIQKPSKEIMISPEKKFLCIEVVMEMLYRFHND
ncbi:hypothetical protein AVEN_143033-1 [Araneus ventricosus]|uniref:Uncharacterized protein n=1 Tax=Araneus ventricosus TaxID=182803 RepID=A0A4Y2KRJ5_ARAVE|nr:hypothetical protein AVEN_143033-1 [Araneus ventricosus]